MPLFTKLYPNRTSSEEIFEKTGVARPNLQATFVLFASGAQLPLEMEAHWLDFLTLPPEPLQPNTAVNVLVTHIWKTTCHEDSWRRFKTPEVKGTRMNQYSWKLQHSENSGNIRMYNKCDVFTQLKKGLREVKVMQLKAGLKEIKLTPI